MYINARIIVTNTQSSIFAPHFRQITMPWCPHLIIQFLNSRIIRIIMTVHQNAAECTFDSECTKPWFHVKKSLKIFQMF